MCPPTWYAKRIPQVVEPEPIRLCHATPPGELSNTCLLDFGHPGDHRRSRTESWPRRTGETYIGHSPEFDRAMAAFRTVK